MHIVIPIRLRFYPDPYRHPIVTVNQIRSSHVLTDCRGTIKAAVGVTEREALHRAMSHVRRHLDFVAAAYPGCEYQHFSLEYASEAVGADGSVWASGNVVQTSPILLPQAEAFREEPLQERGHAILKLTESVLSLNEHKGGRTSIGAGRLAQLKEMAVSAAGERDSLIP